jgi:hypothetical protein
MKKKRRSRRFSRSRGDSRKAAVVAKPKRVKPGLAKAARRSLRVVRCPPLSPEEAAVLEGRCTDVVEGDELRRLLTGQR